MCAACDNITYRNPIPVSVVLLPVDNGLLTVRRNIEPGLGKLCLPGGFIDFKDKTETWQEAGARELREEADIQIDPNELREFRVLSTNHGPLLIFSVSSRHRKSEELPPFVPNEESTERLVIDHPIELAFPFHTQVMREYFESAERLSLLHATA